jgi:hypothetical protein
VILGIFDAAKVVIIHMKTRKSQLFSGKDGDHPYEEDLVG